MTTQLPPDPAPRQVAPAPVTPVHSGYGAGYRLAQLVWLATAVVDVMVGLRFAFKLLSASTQSSFVVTLYGLSEPLVAPFRGIFPAAGATPSGTSAAFVFEPASLLAILIYSLIGAAIATAVRLAAAPRRGLPVR